MSGKQEWRTTAIIHGSYNDRGYVMYMNVRTQLDRVELVLGRYDSPGEKPTGYLKRVAHFRRRAQEALDRLVRQHGEAHRGPLVEGEYKHRPVVFEAIQVDKGRTAAAEQAITAKEWNDIYDGDKLQIDGQKYVLVNSRRGKVLVPIELTSKEFDEGEDNATVP